MKHAAVLLSFAFLGLSSMARAQPAPAASRPRREEPSFDRFIVSADRMFGLNFWSNAGENNGATWSSSGTSFSLLWAIRQDAAGGAGAPAPGPSVVYQTPRLALDYVIPVGAGMVTVGGSLGFFMGGGTGETLGNKYDLPSSVAWTVTPRGGYILAFTDEFSVWLRGGFTYYRLSSETQGTNKVSTTYSGLAINLEPTVVWKPVRHFGFTASLLGDIGLAGAATITGTATTPGLDVTLRAHNYGLTFGAVGSFSL
jgi:hypothetical protein